jgi:hypothetical protein
VRPSNFDKYAYQYRHDQSSMTERAGSAETLDLLPFFEKVGAMLQRAQHTIGAMMGLRYLVMFLCPLAEGASIDSRTAVQDRDAAAVGPPTPRVEGTMG